MKDIERAYEDLDADREAGRLTEDEYIMARDRIMNEAYNRIYGGQGILQQEPYQPDLFD